MVSCSGDDGAWNTAAAQALFGSVLPKTGYSGVGNRKGLVMQTKRCVGRNWVGRSWVAGFAAVAIALGGLVAMPVDAEAQQKKRTVTKSKQTNVVKKSAPRARVTVQRRSFLDAGTEVLPGERKFTDYAIPPGYSPTSVIDFRGGNYRSPLPGPFDLPDRRNPYPWNFCVGC